MHTCMHPDIRIDAYIPANIHACVHAYIHAYIATPTHMHTCTYEHSIVFSSCTYVFRFVGSAVYPLDGGWVTCTAVWLPKASGRPPEASGSRCAQCHQAMRRASCIFLRPALGRTSGRILAFSFGGSTRKLSRNGLRIGLAG
jgi:hypothetical protein